MRLNSRMHVVKHIIDVSLNIMLDPIMAYKSNSPNGPNPDIEMS